MFGFNLMGIVAGLPGLIIAMSLHEYAHARVAVAMGDFTPRLMGRLTLNPMAHIDPVGLLVLLLARFGWAKPVVINPTNFRHRRKGEILVALAGPFANFIVAFVAMAFLTIYADVLHLPASDGLKTVFFLIVIYNVNFGIFNLLPIPPLDGSRVVTALAPPEMRYKLAELERYSFIIFIALLMTPALRYILVPAGNFVLNFYSAILSVIF